MNTLFFTLLLALAGPAVAEGSWWNEYLANHGGSRMVQVEEDEHHLMQAVQSSSSGERLTVACRQLEGATVFSLGLSKDGDPHWGQILNVTARLGSGRELILDTFDYAGGRYSGALPFDLTVGFVEEQTLTLIDPDKGLSVEFSLQGATQAINNIACL